MSRRGRVSTFDILDPDTRSQWAARMRGSNGVIFDCLRPILDALGLDENRYAGRLLMAIDELLNEAGVPEALIVHHMGHSGERGAVTPESSTGPTPHGNSCAKTTTTSKIRLIRASA